MHYLRQSDARGRADHGWLDSRHTFSFANYYDPKYMQFGPLRVINEDRVAPGRGFGTHPHRDMEIISYVIDGALEHRDSMGKVSIIRKGDVQRMSAGTGVMHSEYNASATDPVHFLQIWIVPWKEGLEPAYDQRHFTDLDGALRLVASGDGRDGAITLNADVDLYASHLAAGETTSIALQKGRGAWLQLVDGDLTVNEQSLQTGDGLALADVEMVAISAERQSEFLLFDLPMH